MYDRLTAEHVEPEVRLISSHVEFFLVLPEYPLTYIEFMQALTGKEIMFGYDVQGRPCFHMIPSRQNTEESQRQVDFTVWILERGIDLMGPGVE